MAEHQNVAILRRGYDAFAKGDIATVSELMTADAIWHVGGHHPFSGDYKGRDQILGFFATLIQETEGTLAFELHDVLANREHATALVRETAERKGRSLDAREVHVYHVDVEGRVTEFWEFTEDQASYDAFWS